MTITELRTYRTALETARQNIAKTGQSGTIPGGFSFANWTIEQIATELDTIERKILRRLGYGARRTKPNFNDCD